MKYDMNEIYDIMLSTVLADAELTITSWCGILQDYEQDTVTLEEPVVASELKLKDKTPALPKDFGNVTGLKDGTVYIDSNLTDHYDMLRINSPVCDWHRHGYLSPHEGLWIKCYGFEPIFPAAVTRIDVCIGDDSKLGRRDRILTKIEVSRDIRWQFITGNMNILYWRVSK